MTAPSTTAAGMSGYVPPPPGLPPIDFSNWRLPPPEAPASRGLPKAPPSLPGVGRSIRLRGTAKRITGAQMVQCPGGMAQWTPTMPMPYQQVVQLPKKPVRRGVASDPPTDKTAPVGSRSSQDHGRSNMRVWGGGGRSIIHPRGMQEKASVQPLHQEGNLPSRLKPSVPPASVERLAKVCPP